MAQIGLRKFSVSTEMENSISTILKEDFSLNLTDSKKIADCVLRLSEFYISKPNHSTPWDQDFCKIAYLCYYLPLNEIRARAVIDQGNLTDFFNNLDSFIDFGSGLGSASWNLQKFANKYYVEQSPVAQKIHQRLGATGNWIPPKHTTKSLGIFSYSLTEIAELPSWLYDCEALMFIEPATSDDGRKLLSLRQQLIEKGFYMWAPCTHQQECPLLTKSKTDWCHDRIHFEAPVWLQNIEKILPMKNRTLTMSYLLARKTPAPEKMNNFARLTGDLLNEKGKSRQLVCRGPEREFLAWMHRDGEPQELSRGILIEIPPDSEKKSNELRIKKGSGIPSPHNP